MLVAYDTYLHGAVTLHKLSQRTMSWKIRTQLGPVKKRLVDRINEASKLLVEGDKVQLKGIRTKLNANIESHGKLTTLLGEVDDVSEEDKEATSKALEVCAELNMDANEMVAAVIERIEEMDMEDNKDSMDRAKIMLTDKAER